MLPEAEHIQSEGIRASINNNLSERLQGTFRDRIKTLRGLDSRKTGQRYLDGWGLTYNHFRGHESLGNKSPGQRAKVNPPFREWADVVKKAGAASRPVKRETRPASPSSRKLSPRPVVPSTGAKKAAAHQATESGVSENVEEEEDTQYPAAVGDDPATPAGQELDIGTGF